MYAIRSYYVRVYGHRARDRFTRSHPQTSWSACRVRGSVYVITSYSIHYTKLYECYYFQKADLARQMGNWEEVVKLGNKAFKLDDYPNSPIERFVFIEGYAHTGDWEKAMEYSKMSYRVSKDYVGPLLCQLWKRIETGTTSSVERNEVLADRNNFV